jgi:hypothetical protein
MDREPVSVRCTAAAVALMLTSPAVARADVAAEGVTAAVGSGGSTVVLDHLVTATPGQILLVAVAVRSSSTTVRSVTFGGAALGSVVSASAGGYCRAELWSLLAPAPGTGQVVVTLSGGGAAAAAALSYAGVDASSPIVGTNAAHGIQGAVSLTVGGTAGGLVVDSVCAAATSAPTATAAAGQTVRWNRPSGNLVGAGSDRPGAASVTMQWTLTVPAALGWSIAGVALRPAIPSGASDAGDPSDGGGAPDASTPADVPLDVQASDARAALDGRAGDGIGATVDGQASSTDGSPPSDGRASTAREGGADDVSPDAGPRDPSAVPRDMVLRVGCACRLSGGDLGPVPLAVVALALGRVLGRRSTTARSRAR